MTKAATTSKTPARGMTEVTTSELARELGLSPTAISKAVARGTFVPLRKAGRSYVFDREASLAAYRASKLPSYGEASDGDELPNDARPGTVGEVYSKARAKDKLIGAKLKELQLKQKSGELVLAADVRRDASNFMSVLRAALFAIPDRIAPMFGDRQAEIYDLLTDEINNALDAARSKYVGGDAADAVG